MKDEIEKYFSTVNRKVNVTSIEGADARSIILERAYNTDLDNLWDAISTKERLERWYGVVTGDLQQGGRYQIEGNAEGTIVVCEPKKRIELSWEYQGYTSWVYVTVNELDSGLVSVTVEHLMHHSPYWVQYGSGAGGVGWEVSLLSLMFHLDNPESSKVDDSFAMTDEGKEFVKIASDGWGQASIASGEDREQALQAAENTTAFYTGQG